MRKWPRAENETSEFSPFHRYSVVSKGLVYGLCAQGDIFAVFNKTVSQYMHQLFEVNGSSLEGLISRARFLAARTKAANTISVDLNIYGKRENACKAGDILSSFGVYLQQPVYGLEQFTYYNPHFLHVEEFLGLGPVQETPKFKILNKTDTDARGVDSDSPATPVPEEGDGPVEISSVLSSLSHHAILSKKAGATSLRSELKE